MALSKGLKLKVRKFWGLIDNFDDVSKNDSYDCVSYRRKTGRGAFLPSPILNWVKINLWFNLILFMALVKVFLAIFFAPEILSNN